MVNAGMGPVTSAAEKVESVRKTVNQTSSEVPNELQSAFQAALDLIADQQFNVSKALTQVLFERGSSADTLSNADAALAAAVAEAQRAGLRACRGYADLEYQLAADIEKEVLKVPANVSDLEREKQGLDRRFSDATALHENNDIRALDPLVSLAADYKEWRNKASATIRGTAALASSDKRRNILQILAIAIALALGIVNLLVQFYK